MKHPQLKLTPVLSIPFEENAYIAQLEGRGDCLVVDPGLEPEKVIEHLESARLCGHCTTCP